MSAHPILPGLWQGAAPPYGDALARRGFRALVLCAREHQPPAHLFPGLEVHHAPNDDAGRWPTPGELRAAEAAASWTAARVASGRAVIVTCWAGRNRSGLVTGLAAHELTGLDGATCARLVRERRPRALENAFFERVLRRMPAGLPRLAPGEALIAPGPGPVGPIGLPVAIVAKMQREAGLPEHVWRETLAQAPIEDANRAMVRLSRSLGPRAWLRGLEVRPGPGGPAIVAHVDPAMTIAAPGLPFEVDGVPVRVAGDDGGRKRSACFYCGGPYCVARCPGTPCCRCGRNWYGPKEARS